MTHYCKSFMIALLATILYSLSLVTAQSSKQSSQTEEQNTVTINVLVMNKQNKPVADLKEEDFQIFEEGVAQTISSFSKKDEVPIKYVLTIDVSRSVKPRLREILNATKNIIESNKPKDETFLIAFRGEAEAVVPHFTSDQTLLINSLSDVAKWTGGNSAVLDAIYLSVEPVIDDKKTSRQAEARYAIIAITDGDENSSYYRESNIVDHLRKESVQLFIIGLSKYIFKANDMNFHNRDKDTNMLARLAKETGGVAFFPESNIKLEQIAKEIMGFLRTQYVISYRPPSNLKKGSYRKLKVRIVEKAGRDEYKAITRSGYRVQ